MIYHVQLSSYNKKIINIRNMNKMMYKMKFKKYQVVNDINKKKFFFQNYIKFPFILIS